MVIDGEYISFIEGDGKLFSRTLLPQNPEIVKIGDSGHEFTVEGENFPLNDEDAQQFAGRFRAEISPTGDNLSNCFLHVMQTADSNETEMLDTGLLQADNASGAIIGNKVVMFSKDGSELDLVHYGFSSNSGTDNLISNLIPAHYYQISDMGIDIYTISANSKGLIYFSLDPGEHDITINILTCHADMDKDNEVDGSDLAAFAANFIENCLEPFAENFGKIY